MSRSSSLLFGAALACASLSSVAHAADDVASLKSELETLKADYDSRVAALEDRLSQLEAAAAAQASAPAPEATAAPPSPGASGATAFNPAISVILAGTYTDLSQDPESYRIAGFLPSGDEVGPGDRSFNLGESELTLSAN